MSLRRFALSLWCLSALLAPATVLADGGCHEPCAAPSGTCNAGLECRGDECVNDTTCRAAGAGSSAASAASSGSNSSGGFSASSLRNALDDAGIGGGSISLGGNGGETQGIFLLEHIGGVGEIPTVGNEGLGVFQFYFNLLYPWIVGMGAGIAVFMGVIGGIQIIQAGSDQAGVSNGKNRLLLSLAGLLIILASATILNTLNPTFFQ